MRQTDLSRRRFSTGAALGLTAVLAGCASDDDADEENGSDDGDEFDEDDLEDDPVGDLTVVLENEDGDPISADVEVTVDPEDDIVTYGFGEDDLEEGEHTVSVEEQDDYTVAAESTEDEFDPVDADVTIGEEDETVELTLDGATADE